MIVDFRVHAPTEWGLASHTTSPSHLQGYRDVYGDVFRLSKEKALMSADAFVELLDQEGIDVAVLPASDNESTYGRKYPNERLAEFVQRHPDRLIGLAGADPHKGMVAVREFERAVREFGLKGLNMGPWQHRLQANDPKYYPLYAKAVELDVPVVLHTSINFSRELSLRFGQPIWLDQVAIDFPELKIVASHGGWPWVPEMVAVAWRHPNIYIETSAVRPKYIGMPGAGWEVLLQHGNTTLQDRILFATDWPNIPFRRSVEEVRALPLKDSVKAKWLGENAARLLGLSKRR